MGGVHSRLDDYNDKKTDFLNDNPLEDFPFYVMQFYELAGENLKKPDKRNKEGKDNYTIEIVAEQMQFAGA